MVGKFVQTHGRSELRDLWTQVQFRAKIATTHAEVVGKFLGDPEKEALYSTVKNTCISGSS
jgi:hypothetical protein